MTQTRWFGSTGRRVPAIAIEGELDVEGALVVGSADEIDADALRAAHDAGTPVVVHAETAEEVRAALAWPQVSSVLVRDAALLELDLTELTYGV